MKVPPLEILTAANVLSSWFARNHGPGAEQLIVHGVAGVDVRIGGRMPAIEEAKLEALKWALVRVQNRLGDYPAWGELKKEVDRLIAEVATAMQDKQVGDFWARLNENEVESGLGDLPHKEAMWMIEELRRMPYLLRELRQQFHQAHHQELEPHQCRRGVCNNVYRELQRWGFAE
jgi:hypothetical protein